MSSIRLKCIFDVEKNSELTEQYSRIYAALKEKYGKGEHKAIPKDDLFENYDCKHSYARTTYTGKIKEGIELTELELSMICDSGYSHFGGSSAINSDMTFRVEIFTD